MFLKIFNVIFDAVVQQCLTTVYNRRVEEFELGENIQEVGIIFYTGGGILLGQNKKEMQ